VEEPWDQVVNRTLQAQVRLLHDTLRGQQQLLERVMACHGEQLGLIEQQVALLLSMEQACQQRLQESAIQSFSLDHENIEPRRSVRDLEARLGVAASDALPEPMPF
jgi:hypothetical protein